MVVEEINNFEEEKHLNINLKRIHTEKDIRDSYIDNIHDSEWVINKDRKVENNNKISSSMVFQCIICKEILKIENKLLLWDCWDAFCKNCIFEYIKLKIEEGQVLNIPCINHECHNLIT